MGTRSFQAGMSSLVANSGEEGQAQQDSQATNTSEGLAIC
jgi:hypothetical protein